MNEKNFDSVDKSIQFNTQAQSVTFSGGPRGALHYQPGDIIGESYKLVGLIGQGGMGVVYHVQHILMGQHYALKIIAPGHTSSQSWRRFEVEGRALAKLRHANIVTIYNMGIDKETCPFFVMDLLEGSSLSSRIQAKGRCKADEALDIFLQVCAGLGCAHKNGIIHRDIKPANIMLTDDKGRQLVKIVDFGMARLATGDGTGRQALTANGEILGSPYYMSPEQSCGLALDLRSDIYSLGCSLYETLTGLVPFRGANAIQTLMRHQTEEAPSLESAAPGAGFSQSLEAVVAKCLEKDPLDRYQSIDELAIDLKRIREGKPVSAPYVAKERKSRRHDFDATHKLHSRGAQTKSFDTDSFDSDSFDTRNFDSQNYDSQNYDSSTIEIENARKKAANLHSLLLVLGLSVFALSGAVVTYFLWQHMHQPVVEDPVGAPVSGSTRDIEEGRKRRAEYEEYMKRKAERAKNNGDEGDSLEHDRLEIARQMKAAPRPSLGKVKVGDKYVQRYQFPENLMVGQIWVANDDRRSHGIIDFPVGAPINLRLNSLLTEDPEYIDGFANDNVFSLRLENVQDVGKILARLARWKQLDILILAGGTIDDAGVKAFDGVPKLKSLWLKQLTFSYKTFLNLRLLKTLRVLQIEDYDSLNEILNDMPASDKLEELRLEGRGSYWLNMQNLRAIARHKNLRVLEVKSKYAQTGEVEDVLTKRKQEAEIKLESPFEPAWAEALTQMPHLEVFTVDEPDWPGRDIREFLRKVPAARSNKWARRYI